MIAKLRRRHRLWIAAIGFFLAVAYVVILASRDPLPLPRDETRVVEEP